MPYKINKIGKCYQVINKDTNAIHSKCTTLDKAKKQIKLLYMIDNYGGKKNIYSNIIMSEQQLRNRILNILDNVSQYEQPQFAIGGAKGQAKKKAKAKAKTQKKYVTRKASEAKKAMDLFDMIESSDIYDTVNKTKDIKHKKKLSQWQECVKRYGVRGAKDLYDKQNKTCNLTGEKPIDPVKFIKYAYTTAEGQELLNQYKALHGGSIFGDMLPFGIGHMLGLGANVGGANVGGKFNPLDILEPWKLIGLGGARKKLTKNQQALNYLQAMGKNLTESRRIIRQLKKLHGGNWFDSFKKGFMMPFEAVSKLAPLAPLLL